MSSKLIGYMIVEWDDQLSQWKPITQQTRTWNPWFYNKTVAEHAFHKLQTHFPGVKFMLANCKLQIAK